MADPDPELIAKIAPGVASVERAQWNALNSDPLTSHEFLSLLEESNSVGDGTGWSPAPILIERGDRVSAAAPAYLKSHSQGEYIFDHGWADAFERAGGRYYPKLLVAVPFTPCPGPRLLGDDRNALLAAIETVTRQNGLSSTHLNFIEGDDIEAAKERDWLVRDGLQFHWFNEGYTTFDDFLGACSSRKRKTMRRERREAIEGLEIETLRGAEIGAEAIDAMWEFYQDTGSRKWGRPYLTRSFFDGLVDALGDTALLFLARRDGEPVAGALNIVGETALYGRYWGCTEDVPFLHFELSYYRAIEWAIEHGLATVQAGAQGEHKVARGYRPVITKSAHFLPDGGFHEAVARFLEGERQAVAVEAAYFERILPFKR